jgi:hypothetical protein
MKLIQNWDQYGSESDFVKCKLPPDVLHANVPIHGHCGCYLRFFLYKMRAVG